MREKSKIISRILVFILTFVFMLSSLVVQAAQKKSIVPDVDYVKAPTLEYSAGDIVTFELHTPNYGGRVQYRVILWDDNKKEGRDLWETRDKYYTNWMPYGNNNFNLHWRIDEPGSYRITVYVKRAGIANNDTYLKGYNCDSYMESQAFVVNPKTMVFDKDEQVCGSIDENKFEAYKNDINITAKNVTFNNAKLEGNLTITGNNAVIKNVNIAGRIVIDPGKDGSCTLENVTAKNIEVLSGGQNSIHIKNSKSETMNVNSKNPVRIEVDGDTQIIATTARGYVIFDKKSGTYGIITITKDENGQSVVEFRGKIQDTIKVEAAATIRTGQNSSIADLVIDTKSSTDIIKLEGQYKKVEINSNVKLEAAANTKIENVIANRAAEIKLDKTASLTNIDKKGNEVSITGEGSIGSNTPPVNNGGGGYVPPPPLPSPSVRVGAQTGTIYAGEDGQSATYAVTTSSIADGQALTITGYAADGTVIGLNIVGPGLTVSGSKVLNNASTITVAASHPVPGTFYFKVTINGITSNLVTITVNPPLAVPAAPTASLSLTPTALNNTITLTGLAASKKYQWIIGDTADWTTPNEFTLAAGETAKDLTNPGFTAGAKLNIRVSAGPGVKASAVQVLTIAPANIGISAGDMQKIAEAKAAVINGTITAAYGSSQAVETAAVQAYVNGLITNGVTAVVTNVSPAEYLVTYTLNSATDSENLFMTRLWIIESIGDITGTAKVGYALTAGALTPVSADVSYQWKICSTPGGQYTDIPLATSNTYTLVSGDEGKYIRVAATGNNSFTGTVASTATSAVAAADKAVVTFTKTPADLTLVVKSGANVVTAEADGTYKLAAGSYTYTAARDGYTTLADVAFTVTPEDAAAGIKAVTVTMTEAAYSVTLGTITRVSGDTESTVTIDAASVEAGKIVTLTVKPKAGMQLKAGTLTAGYNNGTPQTAVLAGTGPYTFTMPAYDVTVTAEFEAKPAVPVISGASASVSGATGNTIAKFVFTTDTAGTCYLVLYNAADPKPDGAAIKNFYYNALMNYHDQITAGAKEISFNVGSLAPSTNYNAYVIVVDANDNTSDVTTIPVKTPAPNSAAFTGAALTKTTAPDLSTVYVLTLTGMTGVDPNSTFDFTRFIIRWADSTSTVINYKYNKVDNFNGTSGTYGYDTLTNTLKIGFWNVSGTPGVFEDWDSKIKYLDVVNNNADPNFTILANRGWNINPDNMHAQTRVNIPGIILVPSAAIGDAAVKSIKGEPIMPQDVIITLTNDTIKNSIAVDTDLSSWFVNLPAGLIARPKAPVAAGAATLTITISGTLTYNIGRAKTIAISIPAAILTSNVALNAAVNPNAKFVSADTRLAPMDIFIITNIVNTPGLEAVRVAAGTTVSGLKGAITAIDDSLQTYKVTDLAGIELADDDVLMDGDKLIVTAEAGAPTVTYEITLAP